MLDDDRLTDGHGRTVDFHNTVIIMTSNIASSAIQELAEAKRDREKSKLIKQALRDTFRQVLNRQTRPSSSTTSDHNELKRIVRLQIASSEKTLSPTSNSASELSDAAEERILNLGYDPTFGARPLKRTIQREIA